MKPMKYMKGAGPGPNLYMFWLCFCQMYVVISLLHYIVANLGHPSFNDNIAITSLGAAIGMFFFRGWLFSDSQMPPKIKYSK
jgi:hypothetical protein